MYRAVNTFQLGYKNKSVYAVSCTRRCLFSDKYKTHKYSVGRTCNCWMLNCWYIMWLVGFKSLSVFQSSICNHSDELLSQDKLYKSQFVIIFVVSLVHIFHKTVLTYSIFGTKKMVYDIMPIFVFSCISDLFTGNSFTTIHHLIPYNKKY